MTKLAAISYQIPFCGMGTVYTIFAPFARSFRTRGSSVQRGEEFIGSTLKPLSERMTHMKADRTRDCRIKIHFTEEELQDLDCKASVAGLDRSKYIRREVMATEVRPNSQVDIPALVAVMHEAGKRVDNVLYRARFRNGIIDVPALRRALEKVRQAEEVFRTAFKGGCANVPHD